MIFNALVMILADDWNIINWGNIMRFNTNDWKGNAIGKKLMFDQDEIKVTMNNEHGDGDN